MGKKTAVIDEGKVVDIIEPIEVGPVETDPEGCCILTFRAPKPQSLEDVERIQKQLLHLNAEIKRWWASGNEPQPVLDGDLSITIERVNEPEAEG